MMSNELLCVALLILNFSFLFHLFFSAEFIARLTVPLAIVKEK